MSRATPYSCPGCDLTGKSFAGVDLTNANLAGATLDGAVFTGAAGLAGCNVTGASLLGTDFSGCDVSRMIFGAAPKFGLDKRNNRTTFRESTVPYAVLGDDWSNLDLTRATVTAWASSLAGLHARNAVLAGLVFGVRDLTNVHFYGCNLSGADFSGATLNNAVFIEQSNLTSAKFRGATMPYAVLDTSTLTRTDFTGATLGGASFLQTRMDGTIFDGVDLTTGIFSQPPRFSSDPAFITSLRGATINFATVQKQWDCLDLTNAKIAGLNAAVDLTWLSARHTVFGAMKLDGYTLNNGDFTGARFNGASFAGAKLVSAVFDGATGVPATQPKGPSVTFDNAVLTSASFHDAVLPGSSFIQASLHGATMTNMNLSGANLTGAQLGSQALLFSVTDPAKYANFLAALQSENLSVIVTVFVANGVGITHITLAAASPVQPVTAWVVTDTDTQNQYTVRNLAMSGQQFLSVFSNSAPHANLGDTYMPAAILTQANLYGVFASGVHLYGSGSKLDNAILEQADFSKSNLGTANFSQAILNDAIFDDAVLTGAVFQGAFLVPGQSGRGVSFQRANLQGTKFTTAKLYGANLQDAAMCMPQSATSSKSNGVWLGGVATGDPLYATYVSELTQAIDLFQMDPKFESQLNGALSDAFRSAFASASKNKYGLSAQATAAATRYAEAYSVTDGAIVYAIVPGIDSSGTAAWQVVASTSLPKPFFIPLIDRQFFVDGPVADTVRADFRAKGGVTLTATARISTGTRAVAWQITDGVKLFSLWETFDESGERVLSFRPAMPNVAALFSRLQLDVSRASIARSGSLWRVDNDSSNPFGALLGYVTFNIIQSPNNGPLDIYGSTMRIERLAAPNQLQYYSIVCDATVISADNFDAKTTWPNGATEPGIASGPIQPAWLRARLPPRPPICVPNEYSYCPAPPTSSWAKEPFRASDEIRQARKPT